MFSIALSYGVRYRCTILYVYTAMAHAILRDRLPVGLADLICSYTGPPRRWAVRWKRNRVNYISRLHYDGDYRKLFITRGLETGYWGYPIHAFARRHTKYMGNLLQDIDPRSIMGRRKPMWTECNNNTRWFCKKGSRTPAPSHES